MRVKSLVWEIRGGFPDFEDFEIVESETVNITAGMLERLAEAEADE